MNLSERIADWLVQQGITQVFAVTGGGAMYLNQALGSHPGLQCTYLHHEQACAMAAEGYARIAGKPAVVMVTTGPGGINALNGVFGAYTDSIPMLVISGQVKRATCLDYTPVPGLRQLGDQEGPVLQMARPVTKLAEGVGSPEALMTLLPQALATAVGGRPGPVWLDIPLDVQSAECGPIPAPVFTPPLTPDTLKADGDLIAQRLATAQRPLILAGTGVRLARAEQDLLAFAEAHGIPVATAWTHDLIASDHPLFAGRPGTIGTRPGNFCLQAADLVIVIGSRLNIRQVSYNWDTFAKNAYVVQVDVDPAELSKPLVQADLKITADARVFLQTLRERCQGGLPSYAAWVAWCQDIRRRYGLAAPEPKGPAIHPYALVERVCAQLREDDILVCGNASACILPFQLAPLKQGQRLFSNSGSASMGYDLPAALGRHRSPPAPRDLLCWRRQPADEPARTAKPQEPGSECPGGGDRQRRLPVDPAHARQLLRPHRGRHTGLGRGLSRLRPPGHGLRPAHGRRAQQCRPAGPGRSLAAERPAIAGRDGGPGARLRAPHQVARPARGGVCHPRTG